MKDIVSAVRSRQFHTLQWVPVIVSASESVVHPLFVLGLRRMSTFRSHRHPSWSSTRVILLDSEEMVARAVCHPITNSIRFPANHTTIIALCGVPGPRPARNPGCTPPCSLGALILTLVRLSLHSLETLAISR